MAGPDPRSPIAIDEPGARFRGPLDRSFAGVRVAWSRDLGGLPIDPRVTAVIDAQRATFQALGCAVEDGQPDFSDAREIFQAWRAMAVRVALRAAARAHRHQLKDTIIWNLEQGQKLTGPQLARGGAQAHRALPSRARVHGSARVPDPARHPGAAVRRAHAVRHRDQRRHAADLHRLDARLLRHHRDRACPAISVPCGFTADGLPVGVQIVGRHHDDWGVLQLAYAFEQATSFWKRRPPLAT